LDYLKIYKARVNKSIESKIVKKAKKDAAKKKKSSSTLIDNKLMED
jgi:hypothetical protein